MQRERGLAAQLRCVRRGCERCRERGGQMLDSDVFVEMQREKGFWMLNPGVFAETGKDSKRGNI